MENNDNSLNTTTCYGCLTVSSDEKILHSYNVRNEALKAAFQMESMTLCFSCYQLAQQADLFIRNVQRNQIELHKLVFNEDTKITSSTSKSQSQALKKLTEVYLQPIELTGYESNMQESFLVYQNNEKIEIEDIKVKLEIDEENGDLLHNYDDDGYDGDNVDFTQLVKEEDEDDYPLKMLKEDLEKAGILNNNFKKSTKKCKVKKKNKFKDESKPKNRVRALQLRIETIHITRAECMRERIKMAADKSYLNSMYKCDDCIKGFNFKATYEKHMKKHDLSAGEFECDICKQRYSTEEKLAYHEKYHKLRYRCLECNLVRIARFTIKEHYANMHCSDSILQFTCPHCSKAFKSKKCLRKHQTYKHGPKERAQCEHCNKMFSSKKSLAIHINWRHTNGVVKRHICEECGMGFSAPSQLKYHAIKHTDRRDYYCVECDKSFKSPHILQHHLRTAMPHVNYIELPYPCQHCDKRFAIKRDVQRHMNRVHLNVKPYQCDQCERAYVNAWSLTDHKRLIHEGYKRPMKYPCTMCDKIFDRKSILKSHIRTHTGERPYQCGECPAQFAQAGVLCTHVRLVHRRLTRDGRPRAGRASLAHHTNKV